MAMTNFEGFSHEQLLAMIDSLDPETVKARATQLADAAKALNEIGDTLKSHQVKGWEGEAAHAYQEWVSRAGSATLTLGQYSDVGSQWLQHAAQTMIEVKANTPQYDKGAADNLEAARKYHNDPDAQQLGQTANAKLTADHERAVQQLTKLAQSYDWSATQLTSAQPPTFPAPPSDFYPPPTLSQSSDVARGGEGSAGATGTGSSYRTGEPSFSAPATGPGHVAGHIPLLDTTPSPAPGLLPTPVLPDRGVDVDLDHVGTLPDRAVPPTPGLPVGPGPGVPGGNPPSIPVPPLTLPPSAGLPPLGSGALPATRGPVGIGGKVAGIPIPSPRDTGIVGGRQIATGSPSAGIPRGTVIGAEGPHAGGGRGMPNMMGGGFGGAHGAPGGPVSGRRLAMESGGLVGGRQAPGGGQPFTQGGSGLVRNGTGASAVGHGTAASQTPGKRRGDQVGARPDYLAEDEETWQDNRRVVPPVID
ncbi:WXG100 family type VII secretion target [Streptomyces sp. NPDC058157]|uniref:WXG100 family type VII secretion target n=1 Tax=Streptomyces sp. NPDC058157 TaxID=3346360 RepID=UPI0036EC65F0